MEALGYVLAGVSCLFASVFVVFAVLWYTSAQKKRANAARREPQVAAVPIPGPAAEPTLDRAGPEPAIAQTPPAQPQWSDPAFAEIARPAPEPAAQARPAPRPAMAPPPAAPAPEPWSLPAPPPAARPSAQALPKPTTAPSGAPRREIVEKGAAAPPSSGPRAAEPPPPAAPRQPPGVPAGVTIVPTDLTPFGLPNPQRPGQPKPRATPVNPDKKKG